MDALLADKVARARRTGIAVELILCDLEGLLLRPDEVCGLFGNLLDNALEANSRVCEGKFLAVECRSLEECYYIQVRNAVSAQDRGSLQSPKKDRKNQVGHGLGLRSAERIIILAMVLDGLGTVAAVLGPVFLSRILDKFHRANAAECGTHEELLEKGGEYVHIWQEQAKWYQSCPCNPGKP